MFLGHYVKIILLIEGKIDYHQYLDEIISDGADKKTDFQRIEMIMHIYGRELLPTYNEVSDRREKINNISAALKVDYKKGQINGEDYIALYTAAHTQLENTV